MESSRSIRIKRKYWFPKGINKKGSLFLLDPKQLIFSDSELLNKSEFIDYNFIFNQGTEEENFNNLVLWLKNHGKEFDIVEYKGWLLFNNFGDSRTLYNFLYYRDYQTLLNLGLDPMPTKFTNNFELKKKIITRLIKKQIKTKKLRINENGNFVIYDPYDRTIILTGNSLLSPEIRDKIGTDSVLLSELKKISNRDNEYFSETEKLLIDEFWRLDTAKFCLPKILEYIKFLADKNCISDKSLHREVISRLLELPITISSPIKAVINSAPPSPKLKSSPRISVGGIKLGPKIGRKIIFN